jgi:hypothetical protein
VWAFPAERQLWTIQPLVDAGLAMDEICDLLFRVGFESIVSEGRRADAGALVAGRPPHVQAAWADVIGRMLELQPTADASPA